MLRTVTAGFSLRRSLVLAAVSGLVVALAFPRMYWWWCSWIGFIPLFLPLARATGKRAFLLGYVFGLVFWTLTVSWLRHVTSFGTAVLVLYLSLYPAVFSLLCARIDVSRERALWTAPAVWVLLEFCRSHLFTGFGWALLAYSQAPVPGLIQSADIFGAHGISFLIVLVNVLLYRVITHRRRLSSVRRSLYIPFVLIVCSIAYSAYSLKRHYAAPASARVCVIQPNIPQELKWYPPARQFIVDTYARLNQEAQASTDLIIWPEAAIPGVLGVDTDVEQAFNAVLEASAVPVLFGAVRFEANRYYNSALLSESGEITARYDKVHLVPFGEFIPLKGALPFLEAIAPIGDMTPGERQVLFRAGGLSLGALICFEDLFPGIAREYALRGADVLVNITNDAWYLHSAAAEQHFQASVFRAVENRRYLIRSANTGVSGFVDPHGRVVQPVRTPNGDLIFGQGIAHLEVRGPTRMTTLYARWGDVFVLACCGILLVSLCRRWVPCARPRP